MKKNKIILLIILLVSACIIIYYNYNKNNEKKVLLSKINILGRTDNLSESDEISFNNFKVLIDSNSDNKVKEINLTMKKADKKFSYDIYCMKNGDNYIKTENQDKYIYFEENGLYDSKNFLISIINNNQHLITNFTNDKGYYSFKFRLNDLKDIKKQLTNIDLLDELCKSILIRQKVIANETNISSMKEQIFSILNNLDFNLFVKLEENTLKYNIDIDNNKEQTLKIKGEIKQSDNNIQIPEFEEKGFITLEDYFFIR